MAKIVSISQENPTAVVILHFHLPRRSLVTRQSFWISKMGKMMNQNFPFQHYCSSSCNKTNISNNNSNTTTTNNNNNNNSHCNRKAGSWNLMKKCSSLVVLLILVQVSQADYQYKRSKTKVSSMSNLPGFDLGRTPSSIPTSYFLGEHPSFLQSGGGFSEGGAEEEIGGGRKNCSSCVDRELFKNFTKEEIREKILRKLGMVSPPNISTEAVPDHLVRQLLSRYHRELEIQGDQNTERMDVDEDDFHFQTKQINILGIKGKCPF